MTDTPNTDFGTAGPAAVRDQVRTALEQAQELSTSDDRYSTGWSHAAVHVGDLSILALAMPTKS